MDRLVNANRSDLLLSIIRDGAAPIDARRYAIASLSTLGKLDELTGLVY